MGKARDSVANTIVDTRSFKVGGGTVTMQREWVLCGRCPKYHGPYWYAYNRSEGKLDKAYVGVKYDEAKARRKLNLTPVRSRRLVDRV